MTEILIRGMDMPKNGSTVSLRIFADGKVWVNGAPSGFEAKAIELPPHGRLIDADRLLARGNTLYTDGHLKYATTVIEASEVL